MVAKAVVRHVIYNKKGDGSREHRDKHATGGGAADEHAVPDERRHAGNGQQQCPKEIRCRRRNDLRFVGEQRKECLAANGVGKGEERRHRSAPQKEPSCCLP